MICGGRVEREPVSSLGTYQNDHIEAQNYVGMALLETKLSHCSMKNVTGHGEYTIGKQSELRDVGRSYCIDHCLAG